MSDAVQVIDAAAWVERPLDGGGARAEDGAGAVAREAIGPDGPLRGIGVLRSLREVTLPPGASLAGAPAGTERVAYVMTGTLRHGDGAAEAGSGELIVATGGVDDPAPAAVSTGAAAARAWTMVLTVETPPRAPVVRILDADRAGRDRPGAGMSVKELVGPLAPVATLADLRWLADVRIRDDASFTRAVAAEEILIVLPLAGRADVDGAVVDTGGVLVRPGRDDVVAVTGAGVPTRSLMAVVGRGNA